MKKMFTAFIILIGMQAFAGTVDTIEMKSAYLKKAIKLSIYFLIIESLIKLLRLKPLFKK